LYYDARSHERQDYLLSLGFYSMYVNGQERRLSQ
jgi:hypothetical protein